MESEENQNMYNNIESEEKENIKNSTEFKENQNTQKKIDNPYDKKCKRIFSIKKDFPDFIKNT